MAIDFEREYGPKDLMPDDELWMADAFSEWGQHAFTVAGSPLFPVGKLTCPPLIEGSVGFCPVFPTRETAEEWAKGRFTVALITVPFVPDPDCCVPGCKMPVVERRGGRYYCAACRPPADEDS